MLLFILTYHPRYQPPTMPLCDVPGCQFPNLTVSWETHHCHFCNKAIHALCGREIDVDFGMRGDACIACYDSNSNVPQLSNNRLPAPAAQNGTFTDDASSAKNTTTTVVTDAVVTNRTAETECDSSLNENVDITVIHEKWIGKCKVPNNKTSPYWLAFHIVKSKKKSDPEVACCNLCGTTQLIDGGATTLKRHLESQKGCTYTECNTIISKIEEEI